MSNNYTIHSIKCKCLNWNIYIADKISVNMTTAALTNVTSYQTIWHHIPKDKELVSIVQFSTLN